MALIYCVEDDENIRDLMVYALESQQYEVGKFESGEELFAALEEKVPDLILLDIMLPGDDGLTILRKLRSHATYDGVMVILVTAKARNMMSSPVSISARTITFANRSGLWK